MRSSMYSVVFGLGLCSGLSILSATRGIAADKTDRAIIVQRGKQATALVVNPRGGSGSAFCVSPLGFFVSNKHVVEGVPKNETVTLVLHSGRSNEKAMKAKIVRTDDKWDLVVLKVESPIRLDALSMGDDSTLQETGEVVAFGFPYGTALSLEEDGYPSISVNMGRITALRRDKGDLKKIQTDAAVNPGNSGGPLLDGNGKVVGVIVSGIRGGGPVNFAIPVRHLFQFLARPDVELQFPTITENNQGTPLNFTVNAVPLIPFPGTLDMTLTLSVGGIGKRGYKLRSVGEHAYVVEAVPVLTQNKDKILHISAEFPGGNLAGSIQDFHIKCRGETVLLSTLAQITGGETPTMVLIDGKELPGIVSGIDAVTVDLGGTSVPVNLSRASSILMEDPSVVYSIDYELTTRIDGRLVQTLRGDIPISGPRAKVYVDEHMGVAGTPSRHNTYTFDVSKVGKQVTARLYMRGLNTNYSFGKVILTAPDGKNTSILEWDPDLLRNSPTRGANYKDLVPFERDVTHLVSKPGKYTITFQYEKGQAALVSLRAELEMK